MGPKRVEMNTASVPPPEYLSGSFGDAQRTNAEQWCGVRSLVCPKKGAAAYYYYNGWGEHTSGPIILVVVMAVLCGLVVIGYFLWPLVDRRSAIPIILNRPNGGPNGALADIRTKVYMEISQYPKLKWKLDPRSNEQTRAPYASQPYFLKRPAV
jgi:hypothetical protein